MFKLRNLHLSIYAFAAVTLIAAGMHASTSSNSPAGYREVAMANGWKQIFPGGETICARGDEFSFFYREGNASEVVVDFVGGGACWSHKTCKKDSVYFVDSVDYVLNRIALNDISGIYDHNNDKNPVKDWSHVVIPYCTGDIHWGDNVHTYTKENAEPVTIYHKGAVNAQVVLDWTLNKYNPERLLVTGTSAGGYASLYWLPYIKEQAPNARIVQFSDGAAGVIMPDTFKETMAAWKGQEHAPDWIPSLDPRNVNWQDLTIVDLYTEIGRYYPTVTFSQFNTKFDTVQMIFYDAMGGNPFDWVGQALASLETIARNLDNFQYFHAAGQFHTIIPEANFYTLAVNEVLLVDWLRTMLDRTNIGNIVCTDCEMDEVTRSGISHR